MQFPFSERRCYNKIMERISDRIMYLPPDHSLDRPLLGYIKGERLSVAIDAGSSAAHVGIFYSELDNSDLPLPDITILTHSHWDHSFGLAAIHGISIANEVTCRHLREDKRTPADELYRSYISEDYSFLRKEYSSPDSLAIALPDISFSSHLLIDAGGIGIELMHAVSPHTDDSTLVLIPSEGILFVGDASSGKIISDADLETGGRYGKEELAAFIDVLRATGARTIIHSHAEPVAAEDEISYLEGILAGL